MDVASLVICRAENGTIVCHLAAFSVDVVLATPHHPYFHPYESACGIYILNMPVKNQLKWWAIWLAIHSTVGTWIDYE